MINYLARLWAVGLLLPLAAFAQPATGRAGIADLVQGTASVTTASGSRSALAKGAAINPGDTIETGANGEVHAKMEDGGYLAVRPNTVVRIDKFAAHEDNDDVSAISLFRGAMRSVTGWIGKLSPRTYRVITPVATIGIRGTDHETVHIPPEEAKPGEMPGTHDRVNHGATFLENAQGSVDIPEGRAAFVRHTPGIAPALHEKLPGFLDERRTSNDPLVEKHFAEIEKRIEEKLREKGKLGPGEKYEDYIARRKAEREKHLKENEKPRPERPRRPHPHRPPTKL